MRVICALLLCCSLGLSSGLSVTASDQPALMSEDVESDEVLDAVENTDETEIEEAEKKEEEENARLDRERRLGQAMLSIKKWYGKNAILKGTSLEEGATAMERNGQIGGHKA